jgi:hypothetical protein
MYISTHSLTSALDGGEWSASRPGCFTPRERAPDTHLIEGWVSPRAVLDAVVKRKILSPRRESNPRTLIVQPVLIIIFRRYKSTVAKLINMIDTTVYIVTNFVVDLHRYCNDKRCKLQSLCFVKYTYYVKMFQVQVLYLAPCTTFYARYYSLYFVVNIFCKEVSCDFACLTGL